MPMGFYARNQQSGITLADRLEYYSIPEPNSGCLLWMGTYGTAGYGLLGWGFRKTGKMKMVRANRLAWIAHRGPIPEGLSVLHKCDVRACVNPDHLFLGTHDDNMADMVRKGRHVAPAGDANGNAKLTLDAVIAIRESTEPLAVMAKRYGVSVSLISQVRLRQVWKHVTAAVISSMAEADCQQEREDNSQFGVGG